LLFAKMADESAQLENGVGGDVDLRRDSHPKQVKFIIGRTMALLINSIVTPNTP
jgi:hypothetical protein